jgi:hypothetical protein
VTTVDATDTFFDELQRRGHDPRLRRATGTVRFDLDQGKDTKHWLLSIVKGDIGVTDQNGNGNRRQPAADAVIHTDRKLFNKIVTGEANAMASTLRGLVGLEGDPELIVLTQRLFAFTTNPVPMGGGSRG